MNSFKSHKTIAQIAKKHNVDISTIKNQVKIGSNVEQEHTDDKNLATEIALQHLDEFPDYYTKLKKMEQIGKNEKAVKELEEKLKTLKNTSYDSIDSLMRKLMKKYDLTAKELHYSFVSKHKKTPDEWIQNIKEGTLHHWFKGSKSKDGKPGWVQADGSPCANEPGEEETPKCFSSGRLAALKRKGEKGKSLIKSAIRRKREKDPNQQNKSSGASPTMVKTFTKGKDNPDYIKAEPKLKEEMLVSEATKDKPGKGSGKKDACYYKVKARYDVFPSAYASGSLVQCRKKGAANWGNKSESMSREEERYCPLCDKREKRSECSYGEKAWDKMAIKDEEYSMARSELSKLSDAVKRLKKKVGKGEGDIESWVQSKITKAADYLDTAADYMDSGEHKVSENISFEISKRRPKKISTMTKTDAERHSPKAAELHKKAREEVDLPKLKESSLVNQILSELQEKNNPCWKGYTQVGTKIKNGKEVPNCVPIKRKNKKLQEATRLQAQTGNIVAITLNWRGKYYGIRMFFPQVKLPTRNDINLEIQKVYPGAKVIQHSVSHFTPNQPMIQVGFQGGSSGKIGPSKNYVKPMGEEVNVLDESNKLNKSKMKCNKPKAQAVGDSLTGKSHVVKACENGVEKIIRFGQRGVKGSPRKKGESESYANRRKRFKSRHAKNIKKGKMSAAWWSNKIKW